jgi:FtsP/CotA-like multicopper oxidase with cupredoxin domain
MSITSIPTRVMTTPRPGASSGRTTWSTSTGSPLPRTCWKLIDKQTGAENAAIDWRFRVGDRVKIRLLNEMAGDHPMHHPFHVHGAGRFLILSRDGVVEPNLVWKDTVLLRTGETVDILLDVTNPGLWMAHCHIAEHHESGMMSSFNVEPADVA